MYNNSTLSGPAVIYRVQSYRPYEITRISGDALECLLAVSEKLPSVHRRIVPALLKLVECYLCLTQRTLDCDARGHIWFGHLYKDIVGAIASPRFVDITLINRYTYIRAWNALVEGVEGAGVSPVREFYRPASTHITMSIAPLVERFERTPVSGDEVFYWRNSRVVAKKNITVWIPLRTLALRYGRDFAKFIHSICESIARLKGMGEMVHMNFFLSFLVALPSEYEVEDFACSERMSVIWSRFKTHFVETKLDVGNYDTVCAAFLCFLRLAETYIDAKGPFALATWCLSPLPNLQDGGPGPNIVVDDEGKAYTNKLLVDIPLEVTDAEALDIIFFELQKRIDVISGWAQKSVQATWKRYLHRIWSAKQAPADTTNVVWLGTQEHFARWAARFERIGYSPDQSVSFIRALDDAAYQFALPQTGTLLPHMSLLVIAHPILTPSFFDNCELYDLHGHINGVLKTDNGPILQGYKYRRGARLAHQVVHLTPETYELVKQVIAITTPLRDYLKKIGDDNWRKLFLTCGQGFGYPKAVKSTGLTSDKFRVRALEKELVDCGLVPSNEAESFVKKFSLISLRATKAVLAYIEKPDLAAFAKSLGHARFNWSLMRRYMPTPLLAFFQERWVRLFQTGIIATAMKGSEFELMATGFSTMEQLHEFLKNHALKLHPRSSANDRSYCATDVSVSSSKTGVETVIFGVTVENLTQLLSLSIAVNEATKPVSSMALYWAEYSRRLVDYIDSTDENSVDLHEMLARARVLASAKNVPESLYA